VPQQEQGPAAGEEKPLILIVDDNRMNIILALEVLDLAGFRAQGVRSAAEARDWLQGFRPDAILMDVQLPDQDGFSFTRELKSRPYTADIPVIAVTARKLIGDAREAHESGCDDFITKPINVKTLPQRIEAVIAKAKADAADAAAANAAPPSRPVSGKKPRSEPR
jgi:two-component system cell cycle response regulator DivK